MFWSISQFPELDHLRPEQRAAVLARVPWWTYPLIVARAAAPAVLLSGAVVGTALAMNAGAWVALLVCLPLAVAMVIGLYALQLNGLRRAMRKVIADAFRGERLPFCFECGYDLRESEVRCPECGASTLGTAREQVKGSSKST